MKILEESKLTFFPKITTSRQELIKHIKKICYDANISEDESKEWICKVENCNTSDAYYFNNLIYVKRLTPFLLYHELVHHIAAILKVLTYSEEWLWLDDIHDICALFFLTVRNRIRK